MRSVAKKDSTSYKKHLDVERDTYLPRLSPSGIIQCRGCGAFYYRRSWTLKLPAEARGSTDNKRAFCPACNKMQEKYPVGELHLLGVEGDERRAIVSILRNEKEWARLKNPLERIMRLQQAKGDWKIETTTEKLAQRLGRCVKKARGGKIAYRWGHTTNSSEWSGRNQQSS
jgi:hypothetical protein